MARSFTVIDAPQRSPAWWTARLGRLTGSRAKDMLAQPKDKKSAESIGRTKLRLQLVVERLTGVLQEDTFTSPAIQRGITLEPAALLAYEARTGEFATKTGFLSHNTRMLGCSLDAHIGDIEGILEIKCPDSTTQVEYMKAGKLPAEYLKQVTHNLLVSEAQWCDFLSYDDRLPPHLRAFLAPRLFAKDVDLEAYDKEVQRFLAEVDRDVLFLMNPNPFTDDLTGVLADAQ